jgi:hypothetical protein
MKKIFSTGIFVFLLITCQAQQIDSTIAIYGDVYGQERMYLHFDKSSYAAGETIWFKAYLMKAIFPADESKSLYVDWTDENGKLLLHCISPVQDAISFGQFDIPANFSGNYIHVKAYTKWMLNFDSSFLYNKDLRILSKTAAGKAPAIVPELAFFPEGGDAVSGVINKIAFKANDQWGRPVKIKGIIQNNKNVTVDTLRTVHNGMGFFYINPQPGESFTAKWKDEKGTEHTSALPAVKNSGVSIQIGINGDKRSFLISAPAGSNSGTLQLLGTMYQQTVFKVTKELKDGMVQGIIPTAELPSGILTITVFDNQWKPLAERITYVNNEEYIFQPEMTVQHWGLNKRARNEVEISVPDSLAANLSVSVTDNDIDADSSDNIISHLMLTGELKGKVYNPAHYFMNKTDSISRQLDLVMLTHGWRRFNWAQVVKGEFPKIIYPKDTSYLSVSGKIYGGTAAQLRGAGDIILFINQGKGQNKIVPVAIKPDGSFNDPQMILFDTAKVFYQIPKSKGLGDATVQFMQNRLPPFGNNMKATGWFSNQNGDTTGNARHFQLSDATAQEARMYNAKVLEGVTIKAKTKSNVQLMDEKYTSGLFSGGDAIQFDVLDDPTAAASFNIFNYLQGKVAGLQINTTSTPPSLQWRGSTPLIYLDEMPTDADMVSNISVSDVAYVKVLRPPFMGGSGGSGGAIAIYTRKGNDRKQEPGKGLSNNLVSGYNSIRQFYSPNYESISEDNEKKDFRTTLYWNPEIITSPGKSKVVFTFFNNDVTNSFRVVLEGMTKDGRLAHVEQVME